MRQRARVLPPVGSLSRRLERPGRARQKPGNSASSPTWVAELRHLGHLLAWERQQVAGELEAEQPGHHPAPLCDTSIATGTFPSYALFPAPHTAFKIILFVAQILKKTNNIYIYLLLNPSSLKDFMRQMLNPWECLESGPGSAPNPSILFRHSLGSSRCL